MQGTLARGFGPGRARQGIALLLGLVWSSSACAASDYAAAIGGYAAAGGGGDGTNVATTLNASNEVVVFLDEVGHLVWTARVLSQEVSGPPPSEMGVAWVDPKDGSRNVGYPSFDGLMVYRRAAAGGAWTLEDLTQQAGAGATPIVRQLAVWVTPATLPEGERDLVSLAGKNAAGQLVKYSQVRVGTGVLWQHTNLTTEQLTPRGQGTPEWLGRVQGYVTPWNGQNIAGLDAFGAITAVWTSPEAGVWSATNLSASYGTPVLAGGLSAFVNWGINLTGILPGGELGVTWWSDELQRQRQAEGRTDYWDFTNLTQEVAGPRLRPESVVGLTTPNWPSNDLYGISEDGRLVAYYWGPGQPWRVADLSQQVRDSVQPVGQLSGVALADSSLSVFGVSATGDVLRFFWRPDTWRFENLTAVASACTNSGPTATTRVSVASSGTQGNDGSFNPALSTNGRYVAFESSASNLVPGDTNGVGDVFVHDRDTGATARVSVASNGVAGNASSGSPAISADGRYVAFRSGASNLVPGDTNGDTDVFVYDRDTGATARVSVASNGSQANGESRLPALSGDGRYIAFESEASNLVPADSNGQWDVFVHDRQTGATTRVSVASNGSPANGASDFPTLSADGRYVAFGSQASNLVPADTNGAWDVFVHDRQTATTTRVSVASDGTPGNGHSAIPALSADGRHVAFISQASNLVPGDNNRIGILDVFVHDLDTGATTLVSVASDGGQANDGSETLIRLSADGRYVAFVSPATNLVPGDTNGAFDDFVHDRQTGATTRVNVASDGSQAIGSDTGKPALGLSADGRYVAFSSEATNLVPGDSNGAEDVFVRGPLAPCAEPGL